MARYRNLIITFSILCLHTFIVAQNHYQIRGKLETEGSGESIFYATVILLTPDSNAKTVATTFSGADGSFEIADIPAGSYVLKATLIGYDMLSQPVELSGNDSVSDLGTLAMKKGGFTLSEVQVTGTKPVYMIDGEKTLYNVSEDPAVQSGNASDALQNAPGVEVDVNGNITLRGVSSVEIWLNNKPSNMNAEALKEFIRQLPAGSIERIEVITNPSAKYSAKNSGGIINIVTTSAIKKNSFFNFGINGSTAPYINPFISYVYSDERFSISTYLTYSFYQGKHNEEGDETSFNDESDTSAITHTKSGFLGTGHHPGIFINGSYQADSANAIYFWCGTYGSFEDGKSNTDISRREYIFNPDIYNYKYQTRKKGMNWGGYAGAWYEHEFKKEGHKISADIGYGFWTMDYNSFTSREYNSAYNNLNLKRNISDDETDHEANFSLDYTLPYHKNGEIELGVSGEYSTERELYLSDTLGGSSSIYNLDSARMEDSRINYGSWSAYATIEHRFGNFTIKGGLRTEFETYNLKYFNSPNDNRFKKYWGLFPSIHLSYRTESMHNFKLSYTRRVNNPSADEITSFITYSDDDFSTGNPALRQAYTNSVEAGWTKFIRKFGNIGINAYFKNTKDESGLLTDVAYSPYFGRIVMYSKPINAGKSLNTGGELNVTYQLKTFMSIRFYANAYYMKSSFQFREEEKPYTVDNFGYAFRLNFWAKLWKVLEINASANYASKRVTLFTETKPRYSIDLGLRTEFWKRRISIYVNVNDIFNWNKTTTENNSPYYLSSSTSRTNWEGRSLVAGISFKFGRLELESQAQQGQGQTKMGNSR